MPTQSASPWWRAGLWQQRRSWRRSPSSAAPAVGAALGGSALGGSLTGAAATSHGLAMLGGGSIAAGGLGMVGGTAVVTATGAAVGGVLGGVATSAYVSADPSFRIERLRGGVGPPVVVASGFLTDRDDGWGLWRPIIDDRFPDSPVYRVHWGAKELGAGGAFVVSGLGKAALRRMVTTAAKRGSRSFGTLPGIGSVFAVRDLAANPWTVAKHRAGMTGAILADLIARTDEGPMILVGHSLGARVMVSAAQILGTRGGDPLLKDMHLLGGAVGRKEAAQSRPIGFRNYLELLLGRWSCATSTRSLSWVSRQSVA